MSRAVSALQGRSQSRLRLLAERGTNPLGRRAAGSAIGAGSQQLAAHLAHAVLLLHGEQVLLLGVGERPGDADEDGRRADDVDGPGREPGQALCGAEAVAEAGGEPAARRGRDNVAQGGEAVGEGLALGVVLGLFGDFGVWTWCR